MSSLQCAATLVLAQGTTPLPGLTAGSRVSHVWAADASTAEPAARELGVGWTVVLDLASDDLAAIRGALAGIADRTPGETTVVLALDDRLRAALPRLARQETPPDLLAQAPTLHLVIDADDWVVRAQG